MDESVVTEELYKKYIIPTTKKRERFIGIEIEMPIVNLNGEAVDFSVVHTLSEKFAEQFHMVTAGVDDNGDVYSLQNEINGDNLSYDCSYNNLELSMGKEQNLNILYSRFKEYYTFINDFFKPYNYTLTGMGINPYRKVNQCVPIPNERYRMLFHYLGLYKSHTHPDFFHPYPNFGTFCSASQVQIDVNYSNLIDTINTFSKLEPISALLFSNSVMPEEEGSTLCVRDMFWENSMHGLNPKNIGMYETELTSVDDLFEYIKNTSIYCTIRNGKYINFEPTPILQYYGSKSITGEFWNGTSYETTEFEPEIEDIKHLRTFKFEDLTYRGTIEFRSCCCQPIADSMTVAAFHVGLIESLNELKSLLDNDTVLYGHGWSASQLRKAFCRGTVPEFIDKNKLEALVLSILNLALKGLNSRKMYEEHFLGPLYDRVQQRTNPALSYLTNLKKGVPINELVLRYAQIR